MSGPIQAEGRAWANYERTTAERTRTFNAWKASRSAADWDAYRAAERTAADAFTAWCNADDEARATRSRKYGWAL